MNPYEHPSKRRRSRSPNKPSRRRSRSPGRASHRIDDRRPAGERHGSSAYRATESRSTKAVALPFEARQLRKEDFSSYQSVLAQYLDIQKQLDIETLDRNEVKGRWKSFVKKWNRGELAEGWYDPSIMQRMPAVIAEASEPRRLPHNPASKHIASSSSDDDGPGPAIGPVASRNKSIGRFAASIPSIQDIELQREQEEESMRDARADLRHERRVNRNLEKERLDELLPRATPGTKERQMEKRRELASANRAFADAKAGGEAEINDTDLMGGGDEGLAEYRRKLKETERKKTEREIRREEIMRAKQEERQQRAREIQEKENKTMESLLELARQRFG